MLLLPFFPPLFIQECSMAAVWGKKKEITTSGCLITSSIGTLSLGFFPFFCFGQSRELFPAGLFLDAEGTRATVLPTAVAMATQEKHTNRRPTYTRPDFPFRWWPCYPAIFLSVGYSWPMTEVADDFSSDAIHSSCMRCVLTVQSGAPIAESLLCITSGTTSWLCSLSIPLVLFKE